MAIPASLSMLPAELLFTVASILVQSSSNAGQTPPVPTRYWQNALVDFPALGSFASCSKHVQHAVAPLLYERVCVSPYRPAALVRLVRHFFQWPDHALLVRELVIDLDADHKDGSALTKAQRDYIFNAADSLGMEIDWFSWGLEPNWMDWGTEHCAFSWALLDVLLCQVLDIRKLTIKSPSLMGYRGSDPRLRIGTRLPPSLVFPSLRHLTLDATDFELWAHEPQASLYALLRHAAALTHLRVNGHVHSIGLALLKHPQAMLRSLRLSSVRPDHLGAIVALHPSLELIRLGGHEEQSRTRSYSDRLVRWDLATLDLKRVTVRHVLASLLPLQSTLRELVLGWPGLRLAAVDDLTPLADFAALRTLRLQFGWPAAGNEHGSDNRVAINMLPRGVETLVVGGTARLVQDVLLPLWDRCARGELPNLLHFRYMRYKMQRWPKSAGVVTLMVFGGQVVDFGPFQPDKEGVAR